MWHLLLKEFLESIGFTFFLSDLSIFINSKVIVSGLALVIYVDNLLIAREYERDIIYIKQLLKAWFEVKDLRKAQVVLSIWIKRYGQ